MSGKEDVSRELKLPHKMNDKPKTRDGQSLSDQMRLLRSELKNAFGRIENLEKKNIELTKESVELEKRLAHYEIEDMTISTTSLYNKKLRKFRERRGEDPNGNPGEKVVRKTPNIK